MAHVFHHIIINSCVFFILIILTVIFPTDILNTPADYIISDSIFINFFNFVPTNIIRNFIIFVVGGFIFDSDHLLYYLITSESPKIQTTISRMKVDFIESNPHPYIFHSFEFLIISVLICFFTGSFTIILLVQGWYVHMIVDIIDYIRTYRSWKPWFLYLSLSYLILRDLGSKNPTADDSSNI